MIKYFIKLSLLLSFLASSIIGFSKPANAWINYDQEYYKLKVSENGIYRITATTLSNAGINVNTIDPRSLQLFYYGEEQHIYIEGEADGSFDNSDFIEFYGKKNDGTHETQLYRSPADQPHTDYSLFTDTSVYYLTWSSGTNNKRITTYSDKNYAGKETDSFFYHNESLVMNRDFFSGIPNAGDRAQVFSEFTGGEGFHQWIFGGRASFNISLPGLLQSDIKAKIEALAYSGNNNTNEISDGANHEFGLSLDKSNNVIASKKVLGYKKIEVATEVKSSELKETTRFYMGEISYPGSGFYNSKLSITYPRSFNLGNKSQLFLKANLKSTYLKFTNYASSKTSPLVYDLANNRRISPEYDAVNYSLEFIIPQSGDNNLVLLDTIDIIAVNRLEATEFTSFVSNSTIDYLILSNDKLKKGALDYKAYRESAAGGDYNVQIVMVSDLYDMYGFGIEGPLALKTFLNGIDNIYPNLEHILLLGKGQSYQVIRTNQKLKEAFNLVPTIGNPPSDYLYVSPLDGSSLHQKYSLGRIPAKSDEEISIYLEKLEAYENNLPSKERKKIVQLSGGTAAENSSFKSFLNSYYNIIKDSCLGGYRVLFSKDEPIPVQTSLTGQIIQEMNEGAGMLSYFGHGAAEVTEISLGEPNAYDNFRNTPLFLFNGCALGNTFGDESLAEKFLFEPKNGALGWIASTNYGFTTSLYSHTLQIHKGLFQKQYGNGIGNAMKFASENYGKVTSPLDVMQSRQLFFHGDPAMNIYSPRLPDYAIDNASVNDNLIGQDSIELVVNVSNIGRYFTNQDISIQVKAENSENKLMYGVSTTFKSFGFENSIRLKFPKDMLEGLVIFKILLDSNNLIEELLPQGENNNFYSFPYLIKSGKPMIIRPQIDEIIASSAFQLTLEIPEITTEMKSVEIELDSTPYFSQPISSYQSNYTENRIEKELVINDTTIRDYYIRCRYSLNDETSDWEYTTFGLILDENKGVTQGNKWKLYQLTDDSMYYDTISQTFSFNRTSSKTYQIQTSGVDVGKWVGRRVLIDGRSPYPGWWPFDGVSLMVLNPDNEEYFIENNSSFLLRANGVPSGVYNFNTNNQSHIQDSLINFLNRVPSGYHLIMVNEYRLNTDLWKPELWSTLQTFGITELSKISYGEPFGIFATKEGGPATEHFADYTNPVKLARNQSILKNHTFSPLLHFGSIGSQTIGPASTWEDLSLKFSQLHANEDNYVVNLLFSKDNQNFVSKISRSNQSDISLNEVDAREYPYLRFNIYMSDEISRTPPQLTRWKINYQPVAEGSLTISNYPRNIEYDTLQEGQDLIIDYSFTNIGEKTLDPTTGVLAIQNLSSGEVDTIKVFTLDSLDYREETVLSDTLNTVNLAGRNQALLSINGDRKVLEQKFNNNYASKKFYITKDNIDPTLDVTFDGIQIIDESIVSPNTQIGITVSDENQYLRLDNPSVITAWIEGPNNQIDSLSISNSQVSFFPAKNPQESAKLIYDAADLPSGRYRLTVQAADASSNESSENGYTINFKVVRESTLSNFYPYPNPFSSNTRFIFTLTGDQTPDYLKVQILTVSGKVVKEITQDELGAIKIGNNISDYRWDGTDMFGDELANGVYLYKVYARIDGEDIPIHETTGDQYFKNGFGKLYLIR